MQQAMNALMQGRERERGADVVAVQIYFFFWLNFGPQSFTLTTEIAVETCKDK